MTEQIDAANAEVLHRLDTGAPILAGVQLARDVIAGLSQRSLLHPGPAIELEDVCDPLRRSMRATIVAEGWSETVAQADELLVSGSVTLIPANVATVMGPTTPVWVVELAAGGTRAFAPIGQGPGDVAWFGRDTPGACERLVFLREAAYPVLATAVRASEPIDVFSFAAQGVAMGDDVHVRTQATTNLLIRHLLPALVASDHPRRVEVAQFLSGNHLLFLSLAMAAARSLTAWAGQVEGASVVTTMARNGTQFGTKLSGSRDWFLAPAPMVGHALYHPGKGDADSAPDIGDSAVLELVGLGGAAAAGSPAVGQLVGGVCIGRSARFTLPTFGGRGTPLGVDVRRVVEYGITPKVTTGILHVSDGSGQVGAGVAEAPLSCFRDALLDLDTRLNR